VAEVFDHSDIDAVPRHHFFALRFSIHCSGCSVMQGCCQEGSFLKICISYLQKKRSQLERYPLEVGRRSTTKTTMNYSFWYGGYKVTDLRWLATALKDLANDEWPRDSPVFFDGQGWDSAVREKAAISLLNALRDNGSATQLILRNANLDLKAEAALKEVFRKNKTLQSISIKNVRNGSRPMAIPSELFENDNLKELHLTQCELDESGCAALGKLIGSSRFLETVTMMNVTVSGGFFPISDALLEATSLRKLSLTSVAARDVEDPNAELQKLFWAIGRNTSLVSLALEQLSLCRDHASDLAQLLETNRHLQELSLAKNDLNADAVQILMQKGIAKNDALESLSLPYNPIGDDGVAHLVFGLQVNTTLRTLNLFSCEIWEDGCRAFARGLATFDGIRHVNLDGNELESCGDELFESLQRNVRIESISQMLPRMLKNEDTPGVWHKNDLYFRMNKAKRRYVLEDNLSRSLLPDILSSGGATDQPDVLFQLLCQVPDILGASSN